MTRKLIYDKAILINRIEDYVIGKDITLNLNLLSRCRLHY